MLKYRSFELRNRGLTEALIKSCGYTDEELQLPLIAVVNTWNELNPGHLNLKTLADAVKTGIRVAGGNPFECNTISLCDGIRTLDSMNNILPSREVIADSIELVADTYRVDGLVLLTACDKITPACLMAAARLDLPTIVVTAGAMLAGTYKGRRMTGTDLVYASSGYKDGEKIEPEELKGIIDHLFWSCGTCYGMGTANTMSCLTEALGLSLPYSACMHAVESAKVRSAKLSGMAVVELVKKNIRVSDIVTPASLHNALVVNEAIGGSTNTFIHLPAFAKEMGFSLPIEEFDRVSRETPSLCSIYPNGSHDLLDLRHAGGIPAIMKELSPLLDMEQMTVNGKTLRENVEHAQIHLPDVIRTRANPVRHEGAHAVLKGNLAEEGCVVKQTGVPECMFVHSGPARVFECCEEALAALRSDSIKKGDVIIIRYEGPKGGPGMREMVDITRTLTAMNLEEHVAVVTDGRFSGYSRGAVLGHVCPEAQHGGLIGLLKNGDIVSFDIGARMIHADLSTEEIASRRREWKPKELTCKGYLRRYAKLVTSASSGAVLE